MHEQTTNETQPQEKTITELYRLVEEIRSDLNTLSQNSISRDDAQQMMDTTFDTRIKGYDTTQTIMMKVDSRIASINRSVGDLQGKIDTTMKGQLAALEKLFLDRIVPLEKLAGQLDHNQDAIQRRQDEQQNAIAQYNANQLILLEMVTRVDDAIRGDGDKNGLIADHRAMRLEQGRLAEAQTLISQQLQNLTQVASENARLHREQLEREKKREAEREAFINSLKESARYVVTRGAAWAFGTGAVGTALVAIGQAMIGG